MRRAIATPSECTHVDDGFHIYRCRDADRLAWPSVVDGLTIVTP
jgi:hypothetical protein